MWYSYFPQWQQQPFILIRLFCTGVNLAYGLPTTFSSILTCHKHLPYKVPSLSYLLSTLFSPSLLGSTFSLHHHLPAVSQFSSSNTTHLSSQHDQTTSACFVTWLQQCHQLPACSSLSYCFSFHLNSLLPSISTSSFHSSVFSLYHLSLLAMSHCHTTLQVLCMLYR